MEAAEKAAPEVTAVVARVLTGREQFASILAPRPSLVVIAPRREEDEEERRRRRRRRGVKKTLSERENREEDEGC